MQYVYSIKMNSKQENESQETFSQIFCLNAIKLMCSNYFPNNNNQLQVFPQVSDSSIKETKVAFQSRVADLKLRRINEKMHEIQDQFNSSLENKSSNNQKENENNIDEIFMDEPAPRPKNYKYLTLVTKEKYEPKPVSKRLDFKKIAKEQNARLNKAKEKGIQRAKRRVERMKLGTISSNQLYYQEKGEKYYQSNESSEFN